MAASASFRQLVVIAALNGVASNSMRPMVSYRALELGAGPTELGLIAASHVALSIFGALVIGRQIDRSGAKLFLVAGAALIVGAAASAGAVASIWVLIPIQAVLGLGQTVNLIAAQSVIANETARDDRERRYGLYAFAGSCAQLVGPALGGVVAGRNVGGGAGPDVQSVFLLAIVLSATAAVIAAAFVPREAGMTGFGPRADRGQRPLGHLSMMREIVRTRGMPHAMLTSTAVMLGHNMLVTYLPAFGQQHGLAVELIGLLLAVRAAGSMASRLLLGVAIRSIGRSHLLAGSMVLAALPLAALPMFTHPIALVTLLFITGVGLGIGGPMTVAWVAGRAARERRATALSVRLTGNRVGQLVLSVTMGVLAGAAGLTALFVSLAAILAAGAVVAHGGYMDELRRDPRGDG